MKSLYISYFSAVIRLSITYFNMIDEGYRLDINESLILMRARKPVGAFYAVQTLRAILDGYKRVNIPSLSIEDAPRYPWRGMHLDVSRNFHTLDDVKRLIRAMAMYKMNHLHLHLTDDEGWRIEIPDIPELTEVISY